MTDCFLENMRYNVTISVCKHSDIYKIDLGHKNMGKEIKREHLKNNFLKNIIVRYDYTGIAEVELDRIIAKVKPIFREAGYKKLIEEYATELDFDLQDPENIQEVLPIKDKRKQKVYVFINEEKAIKCKLSTRFALVTIQSGKYIAFSEYSETLIAVMKVIKDEVEFLDCARFGVRKVNQCIIKDIHKLNNYFKPDCFNIYGLEKGYSTKLYESKDCFSEGNYNINFNRVVIQGEYLDEVAYQLILDSDIYITDENKISELFSNTAEIATMNERLFELYKESLTEGFIVELGKEEFSDNGIIGVEKNE